MKKGKEKEIKGILKNKSLIFSILAIFILAIVFSSAYLLKKNTSHAASAPTVQGVAENFVISDGYAFTPKFIKNVTQAEFNFNGTEIFTDHNGYVFHEVTSADNGKVWALYKNVGKYNGQILDLKITLESVDPNGDQISFGGNLEDSHNNTSIGIKSSGNHTSSIYSLKFYKHNTNTQVSVKSVMSFGDIDGPYPSTASYTDAEHIGFSNFDKVLYFNGYQAHFKRDGSNDEWAHFYATCDYTVHDVDSNLSCDATGIGDVKNPYEKYVHLVALGQDNLRVSWNTFWLSISASPFRIEDIPPVKTVNKTTASLNEEITYNIEQYVPSQSTEYYYSSWAIQDTIPAGTEYVDGSVKVTDNAGANVTSKFDVSYNSNTRILTIAGKASEIRKLDFYNNTYDISFRVKMTTNTTIKSNSAKLVNNYTTKTSNTVKTTPKVTVKYQLTGSGQPTDCAPAIPAAETKILGDTYTQKSPLVASGQEIVCGTKKCSFKGWNTNTALTTKWTDGTALSGDLNLYGSYTCRNKVAITYNVTKYTSPKDNRQYPTAASTNAPTETNSYWVGDAYTQKAKLTDGVYDGKRCRFTGWYTNPELTTTWTNGTTLSGNLNLYGKWDCDEPVNINYHVELYKNMEEGHPDYGKFVPDDVTTPQETNKYWEGDTYTAKTPLTTNYDGMICTFTGWNEGSSEGEIFTSKAITSDLDLYGKWDCKERFKKPEKAADKYELDLDDEFTYTITNEVPALTQDEFATYKYRNYKITDEIEDIIEIGNITIYEGGKNVSRNFKITRDDQTIIIQAKSDILNDIEFYGKTYEFRINGTIKDIYRENIDDILEPYKNKQIENKATLSIDNKWNVDSDKVIQELKKVNISYVVIGEMPPAELTDPVPQPSAQTKGTKYTQEDKLTTRYLDKVCVFDGWYIDENFTLTWKDGNNMYEDTTFYGAWRCSELVNDLVKSTEDVKTDLGEEYEYKLRNVVPDLKEEQYYKSYEIKDELVDVVKIKGKESISIKANGKDVKDLFDITIDGNKISIKAKDLTKAEFYNKEYEITLKVYVDKDSENLSKYKEGNRYIIPNKAFLYVTLHNGEEECDNGVCVCVSNCVSNETPEVKKPFGPVTIIYTIVGDDNPDPMLTDPVPKREEILPGEKYKAKDKLTTKDTSKVCTFKGWYTDKELKKLYKDNTRLVSDQILYGSWDCHKKVEPVPDNTPNTVDKIKKYVIIGVGSLLVVSISSVYIIKLKKKKTIKK